MDENDQADKGTDNRTTLALVGGLALLLLIVLFFATRNAGEEDRLGDATLSLPDAAGNAEGCSGNAITNALKARLFEQAIQRRGSDAEAYGPIASAAVIRMENAALESDEDGELACSATIAIDLPPGIVASGGRRNLMGNVDYSVSGSTVALRNAPSLVDELAGLARSNNGITSPVDSPVEDDPLTGGLVDPDADPGDPSLPGQTAPAPATSQPSFNCANARTRSEQAVCGDPGLASLDRQMASQYQRAVAGSPADRQALLRQTRDRFLAYRNSCPSSQCIADAYRGRMQEISDILAGRWQPPR